MGTMDDIHLEELSVRMMLMKMDDAFCEALLRAIDAGVENAPTITSKLPGTRNPKTLTAAYSSRAPAHTVHYQTLRVALKAHS